MPVPEPTPVYRFLHTDNLPVCLERGGFHSSNDAPEDGLTYRPIHNTEIQTERHIRAVPCGRKGVIHDYVPFYFGTRTPMLLQLHTNRVESYTEGQAPLIYIVSSVQRIAEAGLDFVFSDGHGIAAFTSWFDDLKDLDNVDWELRYWADTLEDMDRQRRKQAEFMVYQFCPWEIVQEIGVLNRGTAEKTLAILDKYKSVMPVNIRPEWYY